MVFWHGMGRKVPDSQNGSPNNRVKTSERSPLLLHYTSGADVQAQFKLSSSIPSLQPPLSLSLSTSPHLSLLFSISFITFQAF